MIMMPMSANDMQRCLDNFKSYFDKRHLEVSIKKTIIIVLNKSGKLPKCTIFIIVGKTGYCTKPQIFRLSYLIQWFKLQLK